MLPNPILTIICAIVFFSIFGFTAWIKFHEHLHLHRHEHGPHSSRTVFHRKIRRRE